MRHCALAPLPGRGALSGEILSHDFVEAALMRRAGFGVWIAYDLDGSYEQMPPNLLDEVKRDRRWCQGNLMNARLMFVPRSASGSSHGVFHRCARLPLGTAVARASSCFRRGCWCSTVQPIRSTSSMPNQLFPLWPSWRPEHALGARARSRDRCSFCRSCSPRCWPPVRGARGTAAPARWRSSTLVEIVLVGAARAGPHAVPHAVRARRALRLVDSVEVTGARRCEYDLVGSSAATRRCSRRLGWPGSRWSPSRRRTSCRGWRLSPPA